MFQAAAQAAFSFPPSGLDLFPNKANPVRMVPPT
jgi:hypothetical protein